MRRIIAIPNRLTALPGIPQPVLTATAVSSSQINLSVAYAGPPSAVTYTFEFATNAGGPFTVLTTGGSTYSHGSLAPSTTYYYRANVQTSDSRSSMYATANATTQAVSVGYNPGFPRIGGHFIGSSSGPYSPVQVFWDYCRYLNGPVVIGGDFDSGFSTNPFGNKNFCINYAKSNSNNGALYIQYSIYDHTEYTDSTHATPSARYSTWQSTVLANNWNLRVAAPAGAFVNHVSSANWVTTNSTLNVAADAGTGLKLEQYSINWAVGRFFNGAFSNSSSLLDGLYRDNSGASAEVAGDYTLVGSSQTRAASDAGVIAGIANGCDYFIANQPTRYLMGNHSGWSAASASPPEADISGFVNKWHGGFSESLIGKNTSSFETFGGFALMKQIYQNSINAYLTPKLFLFCHSALNADGTDQQSSTPAYSVQPYQAQRYALSTCLMDQGYYTPCNSSYAFQSPYWFDEFGVDPATGICQPYASAKAFVGWMGTNWIDAAWTTISQSGKTLYARRILLSNGKTVVSIVNPKGNGVVTVDCAVIWGKVFKRLTGSLNATVHSGATGNPVMQDRDGIIGFLQ